MLIEEAIFKKLKKQDKVIDMMANELSKEKKCWQSYSIYCFKKDGCKKCIKEYFYKKVRE